MQTGAGVESLGYTIPSCEILAIPAARTSALRKMNYLGTVFVLPVDHRGPCKSNGHKL